MRVIRWAKMPHPIVDDAFLVREEVFIKEQGFEDEFDEGDQTSLHVVVYEGEIPIACARVFSGEVGEYHVGRVATRKPWRGTGIGGEMMEAVENKVREMGGKKLCLSSQCRATAFYVKQGYQKTGKQYLDEFCPHEDMFKIL